MNTDILIQAIKDAFERAVHDAVDARMSGILQAHAEAHNQAASQIAALNLQRVNDGDRLNSLLMDIDLMKPRIAALELRAPTASTAITEARAKSLIEEAVAAHESSYDHDRFCDVCDIVEGVDFDDLLAGDDVERVVRDLLNGASISI